MKIIHFLIILLALQSSLLFSTPWEDFVKDITGKAKAGDPDAMGILADVMSDLESNDNEEILRLAKESKTKGSPYGKYVYILKDNNIIFNEDNIPFEDFLPQLEEKASIGDCYAAYVLACIYTNGQCGVTEDFGKGLNWLRKAVDQGLAPAQFVLGCYYFYGKGVTKDKVEAVKWFREAGDQGYAEGQCYLGYCYGQGIGVAKNESEAVNWYRKAADLGNAKAQYHLGNCYRQGIGVAKNETEAVNWYRKAADQGIERAQYHLGHCYRKGIGVVKNETEAVNWYRKAADTGDSDAQTSLGIMYITGRGVTKDEVEGARWYRKAADQGESDAQFYLGGCYGDGIGVDKNEVEAMNWYRKGAEKGISKKRIKQFRTSAVEGNKASQWFLGDCYLKGVGVEKNIKEGLKWYHKTAEAIDITLIELANYYIDGKLLPQDFVEGYAYLNIASTKNDKAIAYRDTLSKQMSKDQIADGQKRTKELEEIIYSYSFDKFWSDLITFLNKS
jgi:TPR repeat protein